MMSSWFGRGQNSPPQPPPLPDDSPEMLSRTLADLVRTINRNAGRLPIAAVVSARQVTDVVRDLLFTTEDDAVPDVQVILSVRGIVHDYLPTTLNTYLLLDPSTVDRRLASGSTPSEQLVEQLEALWGAASDVLEATRARDANDLVTQGNFLRTKFSGSDLDL